MGYGNNTVDWGGPDPTLMRINTGLHMDLAEAEDVIGKQNKYIDELKQYIKKIENIALDFRETALVAQGQREAWRDTAEDIYESYAKEHMPSHEIFQTYYAHLKVEDQVNRQRANILGKLKYKPSKREVDEMRRGIRGDYPKYLFLTEKEVEINKVIFQREKKIREECKRLGKPPSGHLYTNDEERTVTYLENGIKIRKPFKE